MRRRRQALSGARPRRRGLARRGAGRRAAVSPICWPTTSCRSRVLARAGLEAVMPAHVVYPAVDAVPAGFSRMWLQDMLRGRLASTASCSPTTSAWPGAFTAGDIVARADAAARRLRHGARVQRVRPPTWLLLARWRPAQPDLARPTGADGRPDAGSWRSRCRQSNAFGADCGLRGRTADARPPGPTRGVAAPSSCSARTAADHRACGQRPPSRCVRSSAMCATSGPSCLIRSSGRRVTGPASEIAPSTSACSL